MKAFVFTAAILASTSAWAQSPEGTASTDNTPDPNQVICRSEASSDTRISRSRTCRTRAEWTALRNENRRNIDRSRSSDN
jgi:hypothetical protein